MNKKILFGSIVLVAVLFFGVLLVRGLGKEEVKEVIKEEVVVNEEVVVPVETMVVKVYFSSLKLNPEMLDCALVFPVERIVTSTPAVARAALEELFKGVSETELLAGYNTNINPGVVIQKLTIEDGVAKVDLNEELQRAVGGSCKTSAIIAQIKQTLLQLDTVKSVVISIDGRTEDILQP